MNAPGIPARHRTSVQGLRPVVELLLAGTLALLCPVHAAEPDAGSWTPLFDGKTTTGWRSFKGKTFPTTGWVIEDGCLKHLAKGGGGDIVTELSFGDFDFEFEWKINPNSNSGVKYFVTEERDVAPGHEYQVIDDLAQGYPSDSKHRTASFYDVLPLTTPREPNPPGHWNLSRIVVRGQQVAHWLNKVNVLSYELASPNLRKALAQSKFKDVPAFGTKVRGHILLQDHGGEVWFRNLRIRTPAPRSTLPSQK